MTDAISLIHPRDGTGTALPGTDPLRQARHDLRNVLNTLLLLATMAQSDPACLGEFIEQATREINRINATLDGQKLASEIMEGVR